MELARPAAARTATLLSVAAALIVATAPASAQPAPGPERPFPYAVGRRDVFLLPAAASVSLLGDLVAPEPDPLGRAELEGLSPDDVNAFDRVAARSWSGSWATVSDQIGRASCRERV